ncbi:hypothetical protein TREMEDRAFT_46085 [Tremella mesenterica DSM 1558]|uniref:uncharacterized protein n=1 Tax=Tremella mesenterica (strain ATCC 24925 / CBS 8224 / DSM 1558 / NBRC 9311 / NRRL Y-6157 / RJB 2259-6 / UBC 559-6) TaxID=578456 RepID=UPI00032D3035|nr:uncharacterized protein TREMEDRAFT_46085 [Tremella mesenterica DSM 1558]EIW65854.1 hypothetical protein TREMEDRAFT_46085 [Tremella mesenterica DSM 1558]
MVGSVDSGIKAAAWSPDEEQLILVTGDDNLVCMTRDFDLTHEEPLRKDTFGEVDEFINVGWGSKTTQFHGSLGKAAALASSSSKPSSLSHPTDDTLPRITFRGDAAFFAISSLDPYRDSDHGRRQIRIYSRDAMAGFSPKLSATSESLPGLEGPIAWRPSGNLLSGLVRYGYPGGAEGKEGRWEVAMLERNGLRHGGFELREEKKVWENGKVKGMIWNADSEVLAIWIERETEDVVQLWTMKNYHYYLKQELFSITPSSRLRGFRWHPEQPLTIFLFGEDHIQSRSFAWDTYISRLPMPNDTASVAVVDGNRLLVTPFRTQITPPPMSSYTLQLPSQPVHVSFCSTQDTLAIVFRDGSVQVWDLGTRMPDKGVSKLRAGGMVADPKLRWASEPYESKHGLASQVALADDGSVGILCHASEPQHSTCHLLVLSSDGSRKSIPVESANRILHDSQIGWLTCGDEGMLRSTDNNLEVQLCPNPLSIAVFSESSLIFALSPSGKLYLASLSPGSQSDSSIIASSVTSFTLTPDFLIYTTASQTSFYPPLNTLSRIASGEDVPASEREWELRRVERGSLAVVACPSSMSLVLQMPRGNLETIYPRPLVLAVVRRGILAGQYREAFLTCRKHRLDLNILYDLSPDQFMKQLPEIVRNIPEVDYLNLLVSSLREESRSQDLYKGIDTDPASGLQNGKINRICDAVRDLLEEIDLVKYVETILTSHICKVPSDYEAGLRVLLRLQDDHPDVVEDAIKYIIFLSDVNKLYDVALGMYNFQLVLMIAQYSQKDPKEYLPFLRELRALDQYEQRYRIDDHLGRRVSALRNLHAAGPEKFEEASSYLARYELYDEAFKLYKEDTERLPIIYDLYGDYLYDRRDFHEAALAYTSASKPLKTLKAYEKAHAWRELFSLAINQQLSSDEMKSLSERTSEYLASRGRHLEAARILVDHAGDVDTAIEVVCQGGEFAEAQRLAAMYDRPNLVQSIILPAMEKTQEEILETFEEMQGQLEKEMSRLGELREIRKNDPDRFYIVEREELEGVDVVTNASTAVTNFTRYTVAPTTITQVTRMTGQTNKSKYKPSKKRATGRKGTVDEYEYLISSLGRLVIRTEEKSAEALTLLRHLLIPLPDLAQSLQSYILSFRLRLTLALEDAWKDRESVLGEVISSGGMGLGGDPTSALEIVRPKVEEWRGLGMLVI